MLEAPVRSLHLRHALEDWLSGEPHPQARSAEEPVPRRLERLRVLVVEDNSINQLVLDSLLRSAEIEPETAADGAEALARLDQADASDPDLIFMDLEMPGMDGYEATRQIRARERRGESRCWIIAISAHGDPATREAARQAGVDDYLIKPVDRQQLFSALDRALRNGAPA